MKKYFNVLAIALFVFMGCDTDAPGEVLDANTARLQGRWHRVSLFDDSHPSHTFETIYWEFSGNNYRFYMNSDNIDTMQPGQYRDFGGTFTCTETTITFTMTYFIEFGGRGRVEREGNSKLSPLGIIANDCDCLFL